MINWDDEPAPANKLPAVIKQGFYYGIDNDEYRASSPISKSDLDYFQTNPAQYIWSRNAPVDPEKLDALDNGSALHCMMLEPDEFKKRFIVMPEFNGRTNQGKADKAAWLEDVKDCGQIILEPEYARKLPIMRESLLSHPLVRDVFESDYKTEVSGFFKDPETGLMVKFRPDLMVSNAAVLCDLKKLAQFDRMDYVFDDHGYHVQNALYSDGYHAITGEYPLFIFIAVSDTVNCGRYEVDAIELKQGDEDPRNRITVAKGREIYKASLRKYAALLEQNSSEAWKTTRTLTTRQWR